MDKTNSLNHLAIIMDGNGRWAQTKNKPRTFGHKAGAEKIREITKFISKTEVNYLTLYAFSTENWQRPKLEVEALMKLLEVYLKNEIDFFLEYNVKFSYIGDASAFNKKIQNLLEDLKKQTEHCTALTQVLALNYGSQNEIKRAILKLNEQNLEINEQNIQNALDITQNVDLLIRTGGDMRISNFLLWQSAYAEFAFSPTLWPDFSTEELGQIMQNYKYRHRRFGKL